MSSIYPSDSSRSNCCIPSPSTSRSSLSRLPHEIDQEDPCVVYWDDHPQRGLIDQMKCRSPALNKSSNTAVHPKSAQSFTHSNLSTPSKRSPYHSSVVKRSSTIADIPSPSKVLSEGDQSSVDRSKSRTNSPHQTGRPLRDTKRRRDRRRQSSDSHLLNQLNTAAPNISKGLLLSTKLNALAARATLRKQPEPENPNNLTISPTKSSQSKGKNAIASSTDQSVKPATCTDIITNQNACKQTIAKAVIAGPGGSLAANSNLSLCQLPNQSPHSTLAKRYNHLNDGSSAHSMGQEPTHPKCDPLMSNQYHPRDKSKLKQSWKPTPEENSEPRKSTPVMAVEIPKVNLEAESEPWEDDEDEEFGSQLLELVDLVEKEQRVSQESTNPLPPSPQATRNVSTSTRPKLISAISKSPGRTITTSKNKIGGTSMVAVVGTTARNEHAPTIPSRTHHPSQLHDNPNSKTKPTSDSNATIKSRSIVVKNTLISKRNIPITGLNSHNDKLNHNPLGNSNMSVTKSGIVMGKKSIDLPLKSTKPIVMKSSVLVEKNTDKIRGTCLSEPHTPKSTHNIHNKVNNDRSVKSSYSNSGVVNKSIHQKTNTPNHPKKIHQLVKGNSAHPPVPVPDYGLDFLFNGLISDDLDWDPDE